MAPALENEGANGGCAQPPFSRVPSYHVLNAAFDATHRWLADGVAPPIAPPIELKQLPAAAPTRRRLPTAAAVAAAAARDRAGRSCATRWAWRAAASVLPPVAAPIARNTGDNVGNVGARRTVAVNATAV